jgi:4-amino-4-deoxy-L-arabinose transferase-like glycosyltransferase
LRWERRPDGVSAAARGDLSVGQQRRAGLGAGRVTLLATLAYLKSDTINTTQRREGAENAKKPPIFLVILVSWWFNLVLGILVGLGFLTKASTYFLAVLVPLAMVLKWWSQRRAGGTQQGASLMRDLALFFLPALILGGMWWARNVGVYGFPIFGLRSRSRGARPGAPPTASRRSAGNVSLGQPQTTFNSFWGQFGWMGCHARLDLRRLADRHAGCNRWIGLDWLLRRLSPSVYGEGSERSQRNAWIILF